MKCSKQLSVVVINMWTILETFILSEIPLVHLFYLILIVTTVSNQTVEEPIKSTHKHSDEIIDNAVEDTSPIPSNVDNVPTINDEKAEQNNVFSELAKRMSTRNTIPQISENEKNNIDTKENGINTIDHNKKVSGKIFKRTKSEKNNSHINGYEDIEPDVEKKIGLETSDDEQIGLETSDDEQPEIAQLFKPENEINNTVADDEKKIGLETSDDEQLEIAQLFEPENTQDAKYPLKPINRNELTQSPIDNVEIVKIKNEQLSEDSKNNRKNKKKATFFREFNPSDGNARIYCTFLGDVFKMYKKVQKRFVGHFCHAIVFGTPIILKKQRVHLGQRMRNQLTEIHSLKNLSLIIVIMQYSSYKYWKNALNHRDLNILVKDIINTVIRYKIDGIQFSNLHPSVGYKIDKHMMDNLIKFFKLLQNEAEKKNHNLKFGITINMYGLSNTKSFTSFNNLNPLVTWYSFESISMVKCSLDYKFIGTSPLHGKNGFKSIIETLIKHINHDDKFDMSKLVVGIQLFPNKIGNSKLYTYEEYCSQPKNTWDSWCAAQPEELWLKGDFLRTTHIGGVQLYYMHSDDYRSTCGCFSFPLIRALLRGLINIKEKEECDFETAHN
ncbi:PREDICTED: uncharacterized protein LOC107168211 [Diuraphis noxia]|uniref:uncharacterized protein LOC107168211 n=1 Tax=Diuraphis noxia TaxID=143948 RepID=UPI0007635FF4|nr:PREDICTED: uncharacterized protein LOC107168211 [Diuraphis noxia]